jgi:hypothetical protein
MESEITKEELIDNLLAALDGYIGSSPDHAAMEAARDLKKLLLVDPETASNEIATLFDGPKTVVTDSFASKETIAARNIVSKARRSLGGYLAKQRRLNREKELTRPSTTAHKKMWAGLTKAIAFVRRLWRR